MGDPDLFTNYPAKFAKGTEALIERHDALSDAEAEWLELEDLSDS